MELFFLPVGIVPAVILVGLGLLIKYKKAYWLIAGYNTMPAEDKKSVDIEGLGRFIANILFVLAAIVLVASIMIIFKQIILSEIAFVLIIPVIIYTLIGAQKFVGNTGNSSGRMKTRSKVVMLLTIAVLAVVAGGAAILLNSSSKAPEYTVDSGIFKISGMYGTEIPLNKISNLALKESMPEVTYKSNGSGLGTIYMGHFELEGIKKARLFVDTSKPPFIYFEYESESYFINCKDSEETADLYKLLSVKLLK